MSPVHPAPLQLADLAAVMRPDWDRRELEGAIASARSNGGWSWPRVFIEVARLMVDEDAAPRDLNVAARDLAGPRRPADPSLTRDWAATCRELLTLARDAS
jgi:hypothetical protein